MRKLFIPFDLRSYSQDAKKLRKSLAIFPYSLDNSIDHTFLLTMTDKWMKRKPILPPPPCSEETANTKDPNHFEYRDH